MKKKKGFRWVSSGIVVLALVGAGSLSEAKSLDKSTAAFCTDLAAYAKALNNLYRLEATDTVADYQKAQKSVDKSYQKLAKAEDKMDKAQNKALNHTNKQLSDAVDSIPNYATLAETDDMMDEAAMEAMSAYVDITTTVCTYDLD